jgi:multidrug resistance protein
VTNTYVLTLPVALFVLGLGIGPLFLAPLSELYGRRIIYLLGFTCFTAFTVGCALAPNMATLSTLRLLAGIAGSAGPALGGGTIGDMFERHERGGAQALYGFGPTCGPVIGGLIGGFIAVGTGDWRWLMWVIVIASAAVLILSLICLRETYGPFILYRKTQHLQKQTKGDTTLKPEIVLNPKELLVTSITRPLRLLLFSPICTVLSFYMAL